MRIATWNCLSGDALTRAAELDVLSPDVVVLQEVSWSVDGGSDRCGLGPYVSRYLGTSGMLRRSLRESMGAGDFQNCVRQCESVRQALRASFARRRESSNPTFESLH